MKSAPKRTGHKTCETPSEEDFEPAVVVPRQRWHNTFVADLAPVIFVEKGIARSDASLLLHFRNVCTRKIASRLPYVFEGFSHRALDVQRWALKVTR
jgi:hypothetical protein